MITKRFSVWSSCFALALGLLGQTSFAAAPTVSVTSPANNAVFTVPTTTITITADASDSDGTITKVELIEAANKLGEDTTAPYSRGS